MQKSSSEAEALSAAAHVMERVGLAMVGAMCGTFVAAQLTKVNPLLFDTAGFIAAMVFAGIAGFYLGIDLPNLRGRSNIDAVELLSAFGTFLAALAALVSVYAFVFDEALSNISASVVVSGWMLGIVMQIGAGVIGRWRLSAVLVSDLRMRPAEIRRR